MRVSYKGMSRTVASYKAYEKHYSEWKRKGYHMEKKLSYKEYKHDVYDRGIKFGLKNIAREAASNARSWRKSEINRVIKNLLESDKDKKTDQDEKINMIDMKFSKKEIEKAKKNILRQYSKKELFHTLAGIDYADREYAGAVIYG